MMDHETTVYGILTQAPRVLGVAALVSPSLVLSTAYLAGVPLPLLIVTLRV